MNGARTRGVLLALLVAVSSARAQDPPDPQDPKKKPPVTNEQLLEELQKLRQRVQELEQGRAADRQQIRKLEQRLDEEPLEPPPIPDELQPPPIPQELEPASTDTLESLSTLGPGTVGQNNLLNPAISVIGDFVGSLSTDGSNNALNRFSVREIELDARAAIAPWVDGVLIASIAEEIEQEPNGDVDVSTEFELEEGYVDFHTLPLDLALRVGKFRNRFGRMNVLHTHDLPQVTRPLANLAFFGHEGMSTTGVSLNWIVPNPWDEYVQLTTTLLNADGGEEAPILGGPNAENPAVLVHLNWFRDVGETATVELGGSYLYTKSDDDTDFDANVFGVDFTYQWLDPEAADRHSFLFQSELYWADNDVPDPAGSYRNRSFGGYAFAQYQLGLNWYTGLRGDYTEYPDDEFRGPYDETWGFSPYITWYITEFLRLRFEYQHLGQRTEIGSDHDDNFYLNLTWAFGAHPPHPYWVNK